MIFRTIAFVGALVVIPVAVQADEATINVDVQLASGGLPEVAGLHTRAAGNPLDPLFTLNPTTGVATINPSALPPGSFVVPPGADPTGATDSLAAVQAYINAHAGQRISLLGRYALSATLVIPPATQVFCQGPQLGGFKRLASATTGTVKPLIALAAGAGMSIENCEVDLNAPGAGNWWAGIAPNGATSNVILRGNQIDGATYDGIQYVTATVAGTHTNVTIAGNVVNNSGANGISAEGITGLVVTGNKVVSTGFHAFLFDALRNFQVSGNYATKAVPPPVVYVGVPGGTENGFLIALAPDLQDGSLSGDVLDDNRNSHQDGIGLGEDGTTSSTGINIGTGTQTFTTDDARDFHVGEAVTAFSRGNPFGAQILATITTWNAGTKTLVVNASTVVGSGRYTDWTLNSEPVNIAITGETVKHAGLFCIDTASNFTVTGNKCDSPAQRGLDVELDDGGMIRNSTLSANTITDVGGTGNNGAYLGAVTKFVAYSDVSMTGNSFIDDRVPVTTATNIAVNTANSAYQRVTLGPNAMGSTTGPPIRVFGGGPTSGLQMSYPLATPDGTGVVTTAALLGPWTAFTPTLACGTGSIGSYTAQTGGVHKVGKTVEYDAEITVGSLGTCAGPISLVLPYPTTRAAIVGSGRESARTGLGINATGIGPGGTQATIVDTGNGIPGHGAAPSLRLSGAYETP